MKNTLKSLQLLKEKYRQFPKYFKIGIPVCLFFLLPATCFFLFFKTTTDTAMTPKITYAFGANFNQNEYLNTKIYEPLTPNLPQNNLPDSISLLRYAPNRLHQGRQGSSVGWASSYAAHTTFYAAGHQRSPNSVAFSPSFIFNQITASNCEGAFLKDALEILKTVGNLPLQRFNYNENNCQILPTPEEKQQAQAFKINGYYRLTSKNEQPDIHAIRQHLAQGVPVVAGLQVGGTFLHQMQSRLMWIPTQQDLKKVDFFGHAMAIVGYDDNLEGGAFQFVNSWGSDWGEQGVTWIRYRDFLHFSEEVYSFYPSGRSAKFSKNKLAGVVQLIDTKTNFPIKLKADSNQVFRPKNPIWSNQQLKILAHNSINCYTYLLQETKNEKSEVLFPYSTKHEAYFGISGSRMFPKKQSLRLNNEDKPQHFAIIFSKRALNWENVNNLVNASRQPTFSGKIRETLMLEEVENIEFKDGKSVEFKCDLNDRNTVTVILEI